MALGIGLKTPLPFLEGGPTSGLQPSSVLILGGSSAVGAATIQLLPTLPIRATFNTGIQSTRLASTRMPVQGVLCLWGLCPTVRAPDRKSDGS